ncbi:SDR family oxidoreductase [Variovorax sp. EBFNA2]|uniref:SDR family oxidoreductase n=1 Tax=Variovorax sp. EBFNA2 TaxID=3342097 RepID=UPI0029C042AC|nr:SDR family oxidoreductase [Variovorax boronicumulans]WPG36298.1 SDR family oxidoreductase [Variovorax boronicumulans]
MQLKDKVVVITGGASGIGLAMGRRFVAEGARAVVLVDRDGARAQAEAEGIGAHAAALDVGAEGAIEALVDAVEARHGPIDLFCSNAGITAIGGAELPDADWQRVMEVNLMAHVRAARALLPRMLERGSGYLLQTASAAGLLSQFDAPYAVSKHAAVAFAEWLSIAYGDRGIGVSCLCPGAVDTPLLQAESDRRRVLLSQGLIDADAVAAIVVEALAQRRFLILTHDFVHDQLQRKVADPERWLHGMRRLHARLE